MFSYYGSKSKIVHLYPAPKHSLIIEPFAGSARYALKYFERDVILIDKYTVIIDVWKYLQSASEKDILGLPELKRGESVEDYNLTQVEKAFLGFLVCMGLESPRKRVGFGNLKRDLKRVSRQLFKIRHWKLIHGEYDCVDTTATWFIDPPYFKGGEHYVHSTKQINFNKVSEFARTRKGQVIVCENSSADWMPFIKLIKLTPRLNRKQTTEVFWTNEKVEVQANLFE
jgi:16S rRNA G966 N2-methylase RsmD